ncbi:MAG: N(4)-(beta-N-acetylglucosaminyl)-L-asparaginase [Acidobacteriota bacterium]
MNSKINRRKFIKTSAVIGTAASLSPNLMLTGHAQSKGTRPLIVSSTNGLEAIKTGMQMLKAGKDTLDAVIASVNIVEDDPKDMSVGYGGLPNEEGDVELDASVMHGPTKRGGAVASIRYIKNPSKVAKLVMERTDHMLLVGEGAWRFAFKHGFKKEELLTEEARLIWLQWKEMMSDRDAWGPGLAAPDSEKMSILKETRPDLIGLATEMIAHPPTGTINCLAVNERGDISGTTTTSGLAFKIPGRVGDSPIVGAGLFVDNEVGAAGSTGRGEENIKICGAHTIVEMMRKGMSPTDACLEACKRVSKSYNDNKAKLSKFGINFYALNKAGEYGGATLWGYSINSKGERRRATMAVHDGKESRLHELAYVYEIAEK